MEIRIRNATGTVLLFSGFPAVAQEAAAQKASTTANCASCPVVHAAAEIPSDPTWFIAGLATGLVLGFVAGKVFSNKKQ